MRSAGGGRGTAGGVERVETHAGKLRVTGRQSEASGLAIGAIPFVPFVSVSLRSEDVGQDVPLEAGESVSHRGER